MSTDNLLIRLLEAKQEGKFLQYLNNLISDIRADISSISNKLVELHNTKAINLLCELNSFPHDPQTKINAFNIIKLLKESMPRLDSSLEDVMKFLKLMLSRFEKISNDFLMLFIDFIQTTQSSKEALKIILDNLEEWQEFITPCIICGIEFDFEYYFNIAFNLVENPNNEVRKKAIFCLGKIKYLNHTKQVNQVKNKLLEVIDINKDRAIFLIASNSICYLYLYDSSIESTIIRLISPEFNDRSDDLPLLIANFFGMYGNLFSELLLDNILKYLSSLTLINEEIIRFIDFGLNSILKQNRFEPAIKFLESLLKKHKEFTILMLPCLVSSITTEKYDFFNKLSTHWLLSGNYELCSAIKSVLHSAYADRINIKIDLSKIKDCEDHEIIFLARKAIGFLHFKPIMVSEIIIDLMTIVKNRESQTNISHLLYDPLLVNYRGTVEKFLIKILSDQKQDIKKQLKIILKKYTKFIIKLKLGKNIPELSITQKQVKTYFSKFNKESRKAFEKEKKKSVFLSIIKQSLLLYGRRSIHYVTGINGEVNAVEMPPLRQVSVEAQIPSLSILDPYKFSISLYQFISEKQANETDH